jgi:hypothetical protein
MDVPTQLQVTRVNHAAGVGLAMAGVVDGLFDDASWAFQAPIVVIDLAGIARVTSFGTRAWLRGIVRIQSERLYFARVSPPMMDLVSTVKGALHDGALLSLNLPYECASCEHDFSVLADVVEQRSVLMSPRAPTPPCPRCQSASIFNGVIDSYADVIGAPSQAPSQAARQLATATANAVPNVTTMSALQAARAQASSTGNALKTLSGAVVRRK